jgi:hypothetical protein
MPCAKHFCSVRASVEVRPRNAVDSAECYRGVGRSFVSLAALEGASPEAYWICRPWRSMVFCTPAESPSEIM